MKPDRGMPLSRYLLTLFLGVFCFLAGYNANGDSEWISNLDTLARVQGNEFGIRDMVFQKGRDRVVVRVPKLANRLVIYVPRYLTSRRLYRGADDEQIKTVPLAYVLNKLQGVSVDEVFEYEIQIRLDPSYQKGELIRKSVLSVFGSLSDNSK